MAKLALFLFAIVFIASATSAPSKQKICSPWLGYCQLYEQCCRGLHCATYMLKCVPTGGLVIPGKDTRPIGDGPFWPGSPYSTTPKPTTPAPTPYPENVHHAPIFELGQVPSS